MVSYGHTILGSPAYTPSAYHQTTHYLLLLTPHTPLFYFTRSSTYIHPPFNTILHCSKANTGGIALCGVFASLRSTNLTIFHNKKLKHSLCVFGTTPYWCGIFSIHSLNMSTTPQKKCVHEKDPLISGANHCRPLLPKMAMACTQRTAIIVTAENNMPC